MSDDREHEEPGLDQQERMGHFVKEAIQASNAGLISTIERLIDGKLDARILSSVMTPSAVLIFAAKVTKNSLKPTLP